MDGGREGRRVRKGEIDGGREMEEGRGGEREGYGGSS